MEVHGYTESDTIDATINDQRMTVPNDPGNRHRQMIAAWEAEGNTIPVYVPPEPEQDASPVEKLAEFLAANPDVAELIGA